MIVLVTGGSGCGKSTWAEKLIASLPNEKRVYIATMQVYDEESLQRVARHRAQRADKGFLTIEWEKDLLEAPVEAGSIVLLEDLVNLTANEMFSGGDVGRIIPALKNLAARCRHLVMVTNDVFSDGVVYPAETQVYLETLAQVNQAAANLADHVVEVVYTVPVTLKGETDWTF
ncbi:MAG: bifunctional adenosylcobinamide kinase/adenosylcobinamide-phosphate guanylyltransferase [Clostridia bacterium]|nr:bifunctional adenosylcobinamide kinase/adenosylcobinamide-phosphate guanylyltransferase [Clostridia bacterium]